MKYYIESDGDGCVYPLQEFIETLNDTEDLKEIGLFEMKRDVGGEMWCEENEDFVEKGDCGRWCDHYKPCNGKSGRCRSLKNGFILTGRKFLLTKDGLREITAVP